MNFLRNILLIVPIFSGLTSCLITESARTMPVEIMKPGIFGIPKDLNVALINRNLFQSDTCTITYFDGNQEIKHYATKYQELSDTCINALARYFENEDYFLKVNNYGSSLKLMFKDSAYIGNSHELHERTQSDVCIFLDFLHFNTYYIKYNPNPIKIEANLLWTISFKNDSLAYGYKQIDTLFYDESQLKANYPYNYPLKRILISSGQYLGKFFGTKAIPSWIQVDRLYYKSNNLDMRNAEKFALENNWLKAAEIWNKETKNKNLKIAAKACYNMALACEMEAKPDAGVDWLVKSYTILGKNNVEHKENCLQYIKVLVTRKKEIERLDKQLSQKIKD